MWKDGTILECFKVIVDGEDPVPVWVLGDLPYVLILPTLVGDSWFWTSSPVLPPKLKFYRSVEQIKETTGEKH